jgi:hypothetical protein
VTRNRAVLLIAALAAGAAPAAAQHHVAEIQVAPRLLNMRIGAEVALLATAYDSTGVPVDVPLQWVSSNINVAAVGRDGVVRAIGPGTALVRAIFQGQARVRVAGTATILVRREGGARAGEAPARPAPPRVPGVVEVRPAPPSPGLDSSLLARIDCSEPFINAANPLSACFDRRPVARSRTSVSAPASCPDVRQARVLFEVLEDGSVGAVRLIAPTPCPEMNDTVVAQVRRLTFMAATKQGRPVRAWIQGTVAVDPKSGRIP